MISLNEKSPLWTLFKWLKSKTGENVVRAET